ncbi:MAG: acyltransferase [Gammaproteobacteria bacterium]|nr:acyltransferase [Gammaproteobacteria bacterium]
MKDIIAQLRGILFKIKCKLFFKKVTIAKGLRIYKKLKIVGPGQVFIGNNCRVAGIKGDASKYVTIDTHSPTAVIKIGDNVSLYASRISSNYQITIGDNVLIEESGIVDTDFHSIDRSRDLPIDEDLNKCRINIGNNVSIGAHSVVIKGVAIGDNVVIVPASVVSMSIKSDSLAMGNPARVIKQ